MEGVIHVLLILALQWQLQIVKAQDANTQCEKSFNTNYGQVSNQDFANTTCSQIKISVNGKEPLLLLCPYFMLKVGDQEYCMTVSWTDRPSNFTTTLGNQSTKKKKKKKNKNKTKKSKKTKKNNRNTNAKKNHRKKGKKNELKDKTTGSRKRKDTKNGNKTPKNKERRKRDTKRNSRASKMKHIKRANAWEENIRLPQALRRKQKTSGTGQRVNKTKGKPTPRTVHPKTKRSKKRKKDDTIRSEIKSYVASYCGTDMPYGLNAFDGVVTIDINPSSNTNITQKEVVNNNEGSGEGETSIDNIDTSLGMQAIVKQQIPEAGRGIHPDIIFQCFWSPSAP